MDNLVVWAADVGSVRNKHFGYWRIPNDGLNNTKPSQDDIKHFADGVARDLSDGKRVALGFESPLFIPIPERHSKLLMARTNEGRRPWSAGAGAFALSSGLAEYTWILRRIRRKSQRAVRPTFDVMAFRSGRGNLLIWEAFVSDRAKSGGRPIDNGHTRDARIAALTFGRRLRASRIASAVTAEHPLSMVGAALLRAGLTSNPKFLARQCFVVKP